METNYVKPLTKKEVSNEESTIDSNIIGNRFDYIILKIAEIFNNEIDNWYFTDAREDSWGALEDSLSGNKIYPIINFKKNKLNPMKVFIDKELFDLKLEIPTKWLTNDFEEELIEARDSYEEIIRKSAEKVRKQKETIYEKQKILIKSIEQKLTKEELGLCL